MNSLDAIVVVAAVLAAIGGWRLGFIGKIAGWAGLLLGTFAASRVVPLLGKPVANPTSGDLLKTLGVLVVGAALGQALGQLVGRKFRPDPSIRLLVRFDQVAGVAVAVVGVAVAVWMVMPAMSQVAGWPSETARGSKIGTAALRALGEPPDVLAGVSDSLGVDGLGPVLNGLGGVTAAQPAPQGGAIPADVLAAAARSVVKVSGPACGRIQSGSGFVVAPGVVATNAHVVAGSESITVSTAAGVEYPGVVEYSNPNQDIAYVRVARLLAPPLTLIEGRHGDLGAVLGFPGGGPLAVQPYQVSTEISARSRDIYDSRDVIRKVLVIGSKIGPGDSGGPLVDAAGRVAGVAFGVSPTAADTAYAIPTSELPDPAKVMAGGLISTGACRG